MIFLILSYYAALVKAGSPVVLFRRTHLHYLSAEAVLLPECLNLDRKSPEIDEACCLSLIVIALSEGNEILRIQ